MPEKEIDLDNIDPREQLDPSLLKNPREEGQEEEDKEDEQEQEESQEDDSQNDDQSEEPSDSQEEQDEPQEDQETDDEGEEAPAEEEDVDVDDEPIEEPESEELDFAAITNGQVTSKEELEEFFNTLDQNDGFLKNFIEAYKEHGSEVAKSYLAANVYNEEYYNQLSDADVLKLQFQQKYQGTGLSSTELEQLFQEDVLKSYKQDGDDEYEERDVKFGAARMKVAAQEVRDNLVAESQNFKIPEVEKKPQKSEEEIQRDRERRLGQIRSQAAKQVKDGKLSIPVGDEKIDVTVSPSELVKLASNTGSILKSIIQDGKIDFEKLAFLQDPAKYKAALENQLKAKGTEEFISEQLNNKPDKKPGKPQTTRKLPSDPTKHTSAERAQWKIISQ